ncbi:hypothetical protein ACO2RV_23025 [Ancylobacter sp. VNQ12]|uniref:hypothetical protein n=1 Tax=Ancylobacter sp. VNQ12 TaxID=3400920 RepID=UPI003C0491B9
MNKHRLYIYGAIAAAFLMGLWSFGHAESPVFGPNFAASPYAMHQMFGAGYDYGCGFGHRFCRWMEGIERGIGGLTGNPYQPPFANAAELAKLKAALDISEPQASDWQAYEKTLQDGVMAVERVRASLPFPWSYSHDAQYYNAITVNDEAQRQFTTIANAAQSLLSKLTTEQQAKARYLLPGLPAGPSPFIGI